MAAVMVNSSADRSLSSHKSLGNANKNNQIRGGILHAPPRSLSYSYPPSVSVFNPPQPPLLPLPISKPNNNPLNRGISCPPINRKINNKTSLKKSKATVSARKADPKSLIGSSAYPIGPNPNTLPKDVSGVLSSSVAFTLSPPPSSLPLPTFSLRPKLSCNAEAAGVDDGATDNLRRLLRLR